MPCINVGLGCSRQVVGRLLVPNRPGNTRRKLHRTLCVASPEQATESKVLQQDPTLVARSKGIRDGRWNGNDDKLVKRSLSDARNNTRHAATREDGGALLGMTIPELETLAEAYGQPKYRGKQLKDGIMIGRLSIMDIANIPKAWREDMTKDGIRTGRSKIHHKVESPDGTVKLLLQQADGRVVETVGIPADCSAEAGKEGSGNRKQAKDRLTVCVSSQVGCPMRCTFCATGKGGFARNLRAHEIVDQVLTVQEVMGRRVTNVVFMGMGEPLLNLPGVIRAYEIMNKDLGIGSRKITISTVGLPLAIRKLAQEELQITLAVSLHAPTQPIRESIIPSANNYSIDQLLVDCAYYNRTTRRRVTFEYILLSGVNDEEKHARWLGDLLAHHRLAASHINLIPWNPVDESEFQRPSGNRVHRFQKVLEANNYTTNIRRTRGLEAAAACGQLRNQFQKTPLDTFSVPL